MDEDDALSSYFHHHNELFPIPNPTPTPTPNDAGPSPSPLLFPRALSGRAPAAHPEPTALKRKRGRPRKYGALSPSPPPSSSFSFSPNPTSSPKKKKTAAAAAAAANKAQLAALGMSAQQANAKKLLLAVAEKARVEKKKKEEQERIAAERKKLAAQAAQAGGSSQAPASGAEGQSPAKKQKKHHSHNSHHSHSSSSARDAAGSSGKTVETPEKGLLPIRPSAAEMVGRMGTMPFAPDWSIVKGDSILDGPVSMEFVSKAITERDGMALAVQTADQAYMRWVQTHLSAMLHGQYFHKCLEREILLERKNAEKYLRELNKVTDDLKAARTQVLVHEAQIESLCNIHKQDREVLLAKVAAEAEKGKKALADMEAVLGETVMTAQDEAYEQAKSHFREIYPEQNVDHLCYGWRADLPPTPGGDETGGSQGDEEVQSDPQE